MQQRHVTSFNAAPAAAAALQLLQLHCGGGGVGAEVVAAKSKVTRRHKDAVSSPRRGVSVKEQGSFVVHCKKFSRHCDGNSMANFSYIHVVRTA